MKTEIVDKKIYKHLLSLKLANGTELDIPYQITANGEMRFADSVEIEGNSVKATAGESVIQDELEPEGNLLKITRRWNLKGNFGARVAFTVLMALKADTFCIPGVVYVKGDRIKKEAAEAGHIGEHFCSIPGCAIFMGGKGSIAMFTRPSGSKEEASSISALVSQEHVEMSISLPGEFTMRGGGLGRFMAAGRPAEWDVSGGFAYERVFYVRPCSSGDSMRTIVDDAWKKLSFPVEVEKECGDIAGALAQSLVNDFYIERSDAVGFVEKISQSGYASSPVMRGSFRGGNIEAAYGIYKVGRYTDNEQLKRMALDTVDFFLSSMDREESLRLDYHASQRRWSGPKDEDSIARVSGELILATTKIHNAASPSDYNPRWIFTAKKLAENLFNKWRGDLARKAQGKGGGLTAPSPRAASYLASAFIELYINTGEKRFMEAASWLGDALLKNLASAIMPAANADTLSRDDAHSYLRAFLKLHRETNRTDYFDAAVDVAFYLKTMTYAYKMTIPGGELGRIEFSAYGAIAEFPGGWWLDPYPAAVALDLLHLWKTSGDDDWKNVALANLGFSLRVTKELMERGGRLFEKYYHTPIFGGWGGISDLTCWPPALMLGAIIDISEQFPEFISINKNDLFVEHESGRSLASVLKYMGSYLGFFS